MHWTDESIILSSKKYGETSALVRVFAQTHGVFAGIVRGANSRGNRGITQPGNIVSATWQARLSEQLGTFKIELLTPNAAMAMTDGLKLAALSSACALAESALPERHPYPKLYADFTRFFGLLASDGKWLPAYVLLELSLLAETGFGLDLSKCASIGTTDSLIYVSPKSGRAVSAEAGEPYKDKMLPLPAFLLSPSPAGEGDNMQETLAGLRLSGYFLDSWLLAPHGRKLPAARGRLIEMMKNPAKSTEMVDISSIIH